MKIVYGPHGRPVSRPCDKCNGVGSIIVKVKQADGVEVDQPAVCPVCRGTRVKNTILRK
jgi:excinuclease UvrABC ATPase subunit